MGRPLLGCLCAGAISMRAARKLVSRALAADGALISAVAGGAAADATVQQVGAAAAACRCCCLPLLLPAAAAAAASPAMSLLVLPALTITASNLQQQPLKLLLWATLHVQSSCLM